MKVILETSKLLKLWICLMLFSLFMSYFANLSNWIPGSQILNFFYLCSLSIPQLGISVLVYDTITNNLFVILEYQFKKYSIQNSSDMVYLLIFLSSKIFFPHWSDVKSHSETNITNKSSEKLTSTESQLPSHSNVENEIQTPRIQRTDDIRLKLSDSKRRLTLLSPYVLRRRIDKTPVQPVISLDESLNLSESHISNNTSPIFDRIVKSQIVQRLFIRPSSYHSLKSPSTLSQFSPSSVSKVSSFSISEEKSQKIFPNVPSISPTKTNSGSPIEVSASPHQAVRSKHSVIFSRSDNSISESARNRIFGIKSSRPNQIVNNVDTKPVVAQDNTIKSLLRKNWK
jgi:hypothetical protein